MYYLILWILLVGTKNQMIVVEFYETIRNLLRYKYDNYPDGSNNKEASGNFIDLWESIFEHYTNQGDGGNIMMMHVRMDLKEYLKD